MTTNAIGQQTSAYKPFDHVGNMIPDPFSHEGMGSAGGYKVAAWLPVQFKMKNLNSEDWVVLMPGKGVALDNYGDLIPAGYTVSGASVAYTQNDIDAGTIDITTGEACASVTSYTIASIDGSEHDFMGDSDEGAADFKKFIGVASYPYLQWSGNAGAYDNGINPLGYKFQNYNPQHAGEVTFDYVLEVPLVPNDAVDEALTFAQVGATSVYAATAVVRLPVAKNTIRTPISFEDGGNLHAAKFVRQKTLVADVKAAGDWHINYKTGVISVYSTEALTTVTVTYYAYTTAIAPSGSEVSKFVCAVGNLKPGDLVKFNTDSNYCVADPSTEGFDVICGQVTQIKTTPQGGLDKVKTAFGSLGTTGTGALPGYAGQMDQMAGTANGGVPAKLHYAGGANLLVTINLISR
jgi:hypothetical protein